MKKTTLMVAAALFSLSARAVELPTFSDVAAAVKEGKQLTFVVTLNACETDFPVPGENVSSVTPNAAMVVNNERVTASDRHFTMNDPSMPGTPVYGYSKFNVNVDGSATMNATIMKAVDYSRVGAFEVRCTLGKGMKVFA
ncbi:VirK family protein [Legionella spiritensis]|uniref:VirK protein n=1 Tax=Legionella spiritensis TaxID=452 RepID=A0A0W0YX25_LEGSP|nr:VirK family protein [Legionella spiritensis]KTD61420.1 VirK protein [Legionella spiritensis]SNV33389.1 VirK protein [Legionella spiritensis]VEG92377.1 VirK protein [Legionella spiritensis]